MPTKPPSPRAANGRPHCRDHGWRGSGLASLSNHGWRVVAVVVVVLVVVVVAVAKVVVVVATVAGVVAAATVVAIVVARRPRPEVTPPPCAQVAPINAEHAGCVGESNPRSLPSTLTASGSAAREGRPQSTRSTLAALGSATPRTLPSTPAASGSAMIQRTLFLNKCPLDSVPCPLSALVTSVRFAELPKVPRGSFPKTILT